MQGLDSQTAIDHQNKMSVRGISSQSPFDCLLKRSWTKKFLIKSQFIKIRIACFKQDELRKIKQRSTPCICCIYTLSSDSMVQKGYL